MFQENFVIPSASPHETGENADLSPRTYRDIFDEKQASDTALLESIQKKSLDQLVFPEDIDKLLYLYEDFSDAEKILTHFLTDARTPLSQKINVLQSITEDLSLHNISEEDYSGAIAHSLLLDCYDKETNPFVRIFLESFFQESSQGYAQNALTQEQTPYTQQYINAVERRQRYSSNKSSHLRTFSSSISPQYKARYDENGTLNDIIDLDNKKQPLVSLENILKQYKDVSSQLSEEDLMATYKSMLSLRMRECIEKKFAIDITQFPLQTQVYFLHFLSTSSEHQVQRMKKFLQSNNSKSVTVGNKLTSFLSLGNGDAHMGEKIIEINEMLPKETADVVFVKYAEIIDSADHVEELLASSFSTDADTTASATHIRAKLIQKANALLIQSYDTIRILRFQYDVNIGNSILNREHYEHSDDVAMTDYQAIEKEEIEKLTQSLESVHGEILLFANTFKTLTAEKFITTLKEAKTLEFSSSGGEKISQTDHTAMSQMYDRNYPESKGYSPAFRELIFHGLEESLEKKEGVRFYMLKKDGRLIAFIRFEDLPPAQDGRPRKYIGSFNMAPELQGSSIGDIMLSDCMALESNGDTVFELYCDATLPISVYYLKHNFVIHETKNLADRPFFSATLDNRNNQQLLTKQKPPSLEQVRALAEMGSPKETITVEKTAFATLPFIASEKLEKGWLFTNILTEKNTSNDVLYAVFERKGVSMFSASAETGPID